MRTIEHASAEKPRPPYSFGMIIAKNLRSLRNRQISGGMSSSSCVICQSSSSRQSSSVGPSRNACSSGVSRGAGRLRSLRQSGIPENSSPSHQMPPASSASCSVRDIDGSMRRYTSMSRRVTCPRRQPSALSDARAAYPIQSSALKTAPVEPTAV